MGEELACYCEGGTGIVKKCTLPTMQWSIIIASLAKFYKSMSHSKCVTKIDTDAVGS